MENMKEKSLLFDEEEFMKKCEYRKPPLGIIPKSFHIKRVNQQRFNDICETIVRYYNAGLKINVEWIEEYNELLEYLDKNN